VERSARNHSTSTKSLGDDAPVHLRRRREPVFEREDVDAILGALYDIRVELAAIRLLLREDDDGEQEETREDPS